MPKKKNRADRRALTSVIESMKPVLGDPSLMAGKGDSIHVFFDNARKGSVVSDVSEACSTVSSGMHNKL